MNSFNNKFINQWKDLQYATVGFEFEFYSNHSFIKTMELLNLEFDPIEIYAFNQYHSDFDVTDKIFKVEPDFSGGSNMIELITGPMNYFIARVILIKALEFIKKNGYTDDNASIHINISFDDINVNEMNPIKLILNIDEDYIYTKFPSRRNNIYARSIKWILPFEDWVNSETALNQIIQALIIPDDTKYYGVNLQKKLKNYLEYRYIGGENYEYKLDDIFDLLDYFVLQTKKSITEPLTDEDNIKLLSYLKNNINWFKQYSTYNEFLSNISGIDITIDKNAQYEVVNSNWERFKLPLFDLIKNIENIKHARINYNTTTSQLEVSDAILNNIHYLKNVLFIDCTISNCIMYSCKFENCTVENGHIYLCDLNETVATNCKLTNTNAYEWSELINCLFDGGKLDCVMKNGVFRSGTVLDNAEIENTVKMANTSAFWNIKPTDKKIDGLDK